MAGVVVSSRGRLQRIPCSVSVKNAYSHQDDREGEEDSSSQNGGGSRKRLLFAMKPERGAKLEARRRRWAVTWPLLLTHHWEGVAVRVEPLDVRWVLPDDINSSWSRLQSLNVNEEEASPDASVVIYCIVKYVN